MLQNKDFINAVEKKGSSRLVLGLVHVCFCGALLWFVKILLVCCLFSAGTMPLVLTMVSLEH